MNKLNKIYSLFERVCNVNNQLLTESQESKSQSEAMRYLETNLGWSHEKADNFVRVDLRNDITSLRDRKIAKFTLGVARMYCNGDLKDARIISDLNATLKLLSAHLNEYDRNLNGLSASELIERFAQVRQDNVDAEKGEIDSMDFSGGSNYKIVPINSFEEAKQYYEYTNHKSRWCLTYMKNMYESYTCDGMNQIYFCLRDGFESIKPIVGENAPLDEYGLSMLSIIVNERGELAYCTTRWNHDNGGSDQSMSAKEVSQVVGVNFYQVFKPNNKWNDLLAKVKERLFNGEDPNDIFDFVDDFHDGFTCVELNKKWNLLNTEGQFLSNQWFDKVYEFSEGYARVYINGKGWNFLNIKGQYLTNQWFDEVGPFYNGCACVKIEGKGWNFINIEGQLLSNQWYDRVNDFYNGFASVKIEGKGENFINTKGQLLSNQWFDKIYVFSNGFARVYIKGKGWNFLNTDGQLLSNQWYDRVNDFYNGFAEVYIEGKGWNFINIEGQLLSNQWYDGVSDFYEGFAEVYIEGKGWNFINTKGQYLTNQWFDEVGPFYNGCARVTIKGKGKNFINTKGQLLSNQWFDEVGYFYEGFARVNIEGTWKRIDKNGKVYELE